MTRLPLIVLLVLAISGCEHGQTPDPGCGNGVLEFGEQCDDGNQTADDGCTDQCAVESTCGDFVREGLEQCDDGNQFSGDGCDSACQFEESFPAGFMTVQWSFQNLATGDTTGCPGTFTQVVARYTGELTMELTDSFMCSSGIASSQPLPRDLYTVEIDIVDPSMNGFATSLPQRVDLRFGDGVYSTVIFNDAGFFELTWVLRGAVSNNVLNCAQANVATIELTSTSTGAPETDSFDCTTGSGITQALLPGAYTVTIAAESTASQIVGTGPTQNAKSIQSQNAVTDLGTITIPIAGM